MATARNVQSLWIIIIIIIYNFCIALFSGVHKLPALTVLHYLHWPQLTQSTVRPTQYWPCVSCARWSPAGSWRRYLWRQCSRTLHLEPSARMQGPSVTTTTTKPAQWSSLLGLGCITVYNTYIWFFQFHGLLWTVPWVTVDKYCLGISDQEEFFRKIVYYC